jgi:hypothetical protein
MRDMREAKMRQFLCLSLCAGLLATSVGAAAAAEESTWRWKVSECLRAQQERDADAVKLYREASAFDLAPGLDQRGDVGSSAGPLYSGDLKAAAKTLSTGQ